jgi:predicted Zn-dependent protease
MFRRVAVLAAAVALTSAALAVPAEASHSWGNYHWARTSNPFTLKVGNNIDQAKWGTAFNTSNSDWSASSVLNLTAVAGSTTGKLCKATPGRVEVCSASYGRNGWLGLASISITGGTHITQGTAKMNDTYFDTATYNNPNEKLHVMCQEVGHTFGLGHTSEDGSSQNTCMDYFSNTGANATSTQSTHPNAHDYAQLESIYAHLDSTSTVGASAPLGATVSNDRSSWGREVHRAPNGRNSVFVRDFGHGNLTVTHVTWVDGHVHD